MVSIGSVTLGWGTLKAKTRYARNGDLHIAYQVVGDGPIDLVFIPGFVSHVEWFWENPAWEQIFARLTAFSRLILWDKRGVGLSDPVASVPTLEERVSDLEAVLAAVGAERIAIFGISEGGPMGLLFAALHPERVSAVVLYAATPCFVTRDDWAWGWSPTEYRRIIAEVEADWGDGALLATLAPSLAGNDVAREIFGRFQRMAASPSMAVASLECMRHLDCRAILPVVRVPTLVLHRTGDRFIPVEAGRYLADAIPGAVLAEFSGEDHQISVLAGEVGPLLDATERFLTGAVTPPETDRVLATVLFTDIVESTRQVAELGDAAWRSLLDRHDAAVRRQLERFRGREVNVTGDGFVATFDGPARAIQCAQAITAAVRPLGLEVRAGLHTGEIELRGEDIAGLAVHICARVAALATAGEVLVSGAVPPLVVGSGLSFEDRGCQPLKGLDGAWRILAVAPH
jgi:pimeloyl-ACP methyl ester carboxylesterase